MKINNRIFKRLNDEPFKTQEINGKEVGFHYMNDTPFLQETVSKGRFYLWTSDGKDYKLLVEKGFYEKVDYFFEKDVNEIWINFLNDVSEISGKNSKIFLFGSLFVSAIIILLTSFFASDKIHLGVLGALILTMVGNIFNTNKVNKEVTAKNIEAQHSIRELLTEEKFNQLIKDQEEYMKDFFEFSDDEDDFILDDEDVVSLIEDSDIPLEEEKSVEEIAEAVVVEIEESLSEAVVEDEPVVKEKVEYDYNVHTVAELREIARERELVGYSGLRKAELIELLKERDK